jgi:surface carbohydrate biosynthesis protein (TIGR04326 family)
MLVEYLPASYQATGEGQSQYFGALPSLLREMNHKVGYLHLHSDGPATRPTRAARNTLRQLNGAAATHELVADYLTIGVWLRAVRTWWKLRRNAPTSAAIQTAILPNSNLAHLWPSWQPMYEQSVRGTHSVRTCLLSAMFDAAVKHRSPSTVWISAFEGQSWEACLARSLEHHKVKWVPYLHTMMRPWDLRARSFLGEITPEVLAVHGQHDKEELAPLGVPLTDVEALRYQHLGSSGKPEIGTHAATPLNNRVWLVVGGAECTQSNNELAEFLAAMSRHSVQRSVVVRWHPQCGTPAMQLPNNVVLTTEPLATVAKQVAGALLVGTAAPLDTYLSGVPSCAFVATSGFAMSPIEENAYFHAAASADNAVSWLQTAESSAGFVPPVADYFIIDASLQRWSKLLRSLVAA